MELPKKRKMKRSKDAFIPVPMFVDHLRFQSDKNKSKDKMATYKAIEKWCSARIDMDSVNVEAMLQDSVEEFKRVYAEENKGITNMALSFVKLSFLTDLNIKPLEDLASIFHGNEIELRILKGKVAEPNIKEVDYTKFTLSPEENRKMDIIKRLNEVVEDAGAFNRISKGHVAHLFPFIDFDHRLNKLVMARPQGRR